MIKANLTVVLRHLRKAADPRTAPDLTDGDLLERFNRNHEEAAFTLLVERHGPMVLGVCRRLLGHAHEAEDAFQAVFLILARKATSIHRRNSLGSWLYGVTRRVAANARASSSRRRARETEAVRKLVSAHCHDEPGRHELQLVLDEEIHRLPEKYRVPVVLCYLEGKTHEEAAHELAWPKSSLSARLNYARQLLQERLTRRGIGLSAGLLAVTLTEQASAAVPALLALSAVRMAMLAATGKALAVTTPAVVLANGAVKGATLTKFLLAAGLLLSVGLAFVGAGVLGRPAELGRELAAAPIREGTRVDRWGDPLPPGAIMRLGTVRYRHGARPTFLPDSKTVVSATQGTAIHFEPSEKEKERIRAFLTKLDDDSYDAREAASRELLKVGFHAESALRRALTDSPSAEVRIRARQLRQQILSTPRAALRGHTGDVESAAFSPDGAVLVSGSKDGTVRLWDLTAHKETARYLPPR